jgi:protein-disulfide isomerase
MSRKRKSNGSSSDKAGAAGAPRKPRAHASRGPSKLALGVAALGLGVLVFVLVGTPKPPPVGVPVHTSNALAPSDLESWENAPVENITYSKDKDESVGPEEAPVTIVEFSDFECPYCRDGSAELKKLFDRYPGTVRVVFRNYPLDTACNPYMPRSGHLYACRAAMMARCAGAEGRFWQMHDALFQMPQMNLNALDELIPKLGLSTDAFSACMANAATLASVKADIEDGHRLGVDGTPTLFVNGKKSPSSSATTLSTIVDRILGGSEGDR